MNNHDATEAAYRNGYAAGTFSAMRQMSVPLWLALKGG